MRIKFIKAYGLSVPGDVIDPPASVAIELINSGKAVAVDLDGDGKAEGGKAGEKKAFSRPPQDKKKGGR